MIKGRTFVLIHGSWHGAWCWYKVVPLLNRRGHRAIAVDLPGHGRSWRSPHEVSMQDYVEAVTNVIDQQPEPVVLVGHSRGGIVVSQAAEARPDRIARSIYLSGFLIANGATMLDTAMSDRESLIVKNLLVDEAGGSHMLKREAFREALYHDCSEEDLTLAFHLLTPEPNAPVGTPMKLSDGAFGRVPRTYIECGKDRGISLAVQRRMQETVGVDEVKRISSSHSPFLSQPETLVALLAGAGGN